MRPPPPRSPLFPYTTLFRSNLRLTLLAVPPVLILIHRDLRLNETGVGVLTSLPVLVMAIAAVPGSLLIARADRKSTRLNSSHPSISYAVLCLKKKIADDAVP